MNNKEIEEIKKVMISNLKNGIEENMLENFVENFDEWKMKLNSVNALVNHVDPSISPYSYNDFCKGIIEITKNSFEKVVEYDKLFLTSSEYFKIMQENSLDEDKMEKAMLEELNKKFMNNLMLVLNKEHLKESVRFKLKDQFSLVEKELDLSLEIAKEILRKHEEENGE